MKKTLEESKQRILEIISQTDNNDAINRLKSNDVVYMELKESKFMCGFCVFFKDRFCNNNKIKSIVSGDKGCCNLYSPKAKDIVESNEWALNIKNKESIDESKKSEYDTNKGALMRSKTISQEMKDEILKYFNGGSTYHEGGHIHGLTKPKELTEKSPKADGVSLGADKDGFFVYTHRARSHSHASPDKIPIKEINFIESTG